MCTHHNVSIEPALVHGIQESLFKMSSLLFLTGDSRRLLSLLLSLLLCPLALTGLSPLPTCTDMSNHTTPRPLYESEARKCRYIPACLKSR